jgi:hypothetical protein
LGLEGLDKLDLFQSLTAIGIHAELQPKYWLSLDTEGRISIHDLDYGAHGSMNLALLLTLPQYKSSSYAVIPSWCWSMLTARKGVLFAQF